MRVTFTQKSSGIGADVIETNDYYPFGMNHLNPDTTSQFGQGAFENYKYNGKELQETGMYDYGARFYMPDIGRWGVQDLLSEFYYSYSPYNYVGNNPIIRTDPSGADWYTDKNGNYQYNSNLTKDNADQFFKDNKIDGGRYFAASGTAISGYNLGKENQEITSSYHLNDDGTVTDNLTGKNIDSGSTQELDNSGISVTANDDRPNIGTYKNGETFNSKDGNTYEVVNNEWVKQSGVLAPENAYRISPGLAPSFYPNQNYVDTGVMEAAGKQHLNKVIVEPIKDYIIGGAIARKFEVASTQIITLTFLYNNFRYVYDQINENQKHDEEAVIFPKNCII